MKGRKIILGITGSIAAYKAAILTRLLVKEGAEVKVIMTESAKDFITPLTLSTLSKNPVLSQFVKNEAGEWNNHVALGLWADAIVIAPASANTLAKMAHGECDNLLLAVYLSSRCPVFIAPAMDLDMLQHPSTKRNLQTLKEYGNHQITPGHGELASGLIGTGRMAEPEEIMEQLALFFSEKKKLSGKHALVTAGPTHEALDPVRFIGNNSSGKMGFAIAEALAHSGAKVTLITGPTHLTLSHPEIEIKNVTSAADMFEASQAIFHGIDIAVFAAAVADYRPATIADQKIKKSDTDLTLQLVKTHDIATELGGQKRKDQFTVGFALETENEVQNAKKKIAAKNFDLIVLNSPNDTGAGFGHDTNKITLIDKKGEIVEFSLKNKKDVASDIVNAIVQRYA
ncbi:MAG: bifunctional phosphopantothenoylcysteine decarboxylase/phosphopantothenate--cysteine ligase CoaBC [Cyclobacteriaceae bacterium]|nr:bifunctional phosphopantothenoylcysteine decarboxylase/phosphopantothenate--cysteine ligase CoaBC [Cyclobacteriaceae bacterium]